MAHLKLVRTSFLGKCWYKYGPALAYFAGYSVWIGLFKLLSLTIITYFVLVSRTHVTHFEDVNDAYGSAQISILAFCSLSFVVLQRLLDPLQKRENTSLFTPQRFEKLFLPGFTHGSVLAAGVLVAFLFSGIYHYLGFFVHFDQSVLALASIFIRVISIGVLVYTEEYIFREKIMGSIRRADSETTPNILELPNLPLKQQQLRLAAHLRNQEFAAVAATSVLYLASKYLQFDSELGWMNGITLFLISVYLGLRMLFGRDFTPGAGFWTAVLVVFNPLMSLPIFGNEFGGLILIKYQQIATELGSQASDTTRFFSGGVGGPLAGFAFQILMIFDIARNALRYKKNEIIKS